MKNAEPKKLGTHSGERVLYQPSSRQIRKEGTIVTCAGSIIVESSERSAALLPGQLSRANA